MGLRVYGFRDELWVYGFRGLGRIGVRGLGGLGRIGFRGLGG